jgi:hypothetical protein
MKNTFSNQRLSAGDSDLGDPKACAYPDNTEYLFIAQYLMARELGNQILGDAV